MKVPADGNIGKRGGISGCRPLFLTAVIFLFTLIMVQLTDKEAI
jgi:hypothetical protein